MAGLIVISAAGPNKQVSPWEAGCLLMCMGTMTRTVWQAQRGHQVAGMWQSTQEKSGGRRSLFMGDIDVNKL